MLEEPLAINTSEENHLVTSVICHVVKPGREEGLRACFMVLPQITKIQGTSGCQHYSTPGSRSSEYVVILKFDCYDNLKTWLRI